MIKIPSKWNALEPSDSYEFVIHSISDWLKVSERNKVHYDQELLRCKSQILEKLFLVRLFNFTRRFKLLEVAFGETLVYKLFPGFLQMVK